MNIFRFAGTRDIELSGTTLTVYHRTKNQDIAGSICTVGFIAGGGRAYGTGIYSTFNLASSLKNSNLTAYGGEVLKATVDIKGFLIFNEELAKQVYGANYKLIDQVNNIIGVNNVVSPSNRQKDLEYLESQSKRLEEGVEWSSDVANGVSNRLRLDQSGVPGILFGGRTDGLVCVAYKQILVTPVAHAWIDGKTYKFAKWEPCPQRSVEELTALQKDDEKSEKFVAARRSLLDGLASMDRGGRIRREDYPDIPEGVFDQAVANYIYEDESRIAKLDPQLRAKLKDVIEIDFLIRKLKSAPTHYWEEWLKVSEETKAKVPKEIINEIWSDYLKANKGHWKNVPEDIRPLIPKTGEAKYWAAALKKSQDNWKYIPADIAEYMESEMDIIPPANLKDLQAEGAEERQAETEELDVPDSAMSWVQDQVAKMNKRAGRLGLHPIILEIVSEDRKERTKKIKVMGNVPVLKGNKLMARLEDIEDDQGNVSRVVETLSDEALPSPISITGKKGTLSVDLETAPLICQHCNMNRRRKEAYIIKRVAENTYLMVASSCLGDFIGELGGAATPDAIAKYASEFKHMLVLFKEGNENQGKTDQQIRKDYKAKGVPIAFFLTKVLSLEKQNGFVPSSRYNSSKEPTAHLAWLMCIDLNYDQKYSKPIDASDISLIDSALGWISTIEEEKNSYGQKEFLYNVKKSCDVGTVFEKRGKGNAGLVAWLPTLYKKNVEEKEDFSKLMGEKGDQIFFKGTLLSKTPILVQISQQVTTNKNTRQNYCIAESDDGRRVAWIEEKPITADVGKTLFIKGTVDKNGDIDSKSSAHLINVEEIPEQEYVTHEPEMAQKLRDFEKKHAEEKAKEEAAKPVPDQPAQPTQPLSGSPQGNYQNGANIVEDYIIMSVRPANRGQSLYFFQDNYGKRVSAFTDLNIGKKDDKVRLSATVQLNKGYINLVNIKVLPRDQSAAATSSTTLTPAAQPTAFQDGQIYEDDFTIKSARPAAYNSTLYTLSDSLGRMVSSFIKAFLGNIGSQIRLRGIIKIKGPYINLTSVKVVPKQSQAPSTPTAPLSSPTNFTTPQGASPVQPSPQAQQAQTNTNVPAPTASKHNWYRLASIKDFIFGPKEKKENENTNENLAKKPSDLAQPSQQDDDKRKFKYPDEIDMQKAYDRFKGSYEKATGKAWTFDKFKQRAGNWKFYGDEDGYITVKEQNSGMYKLVGVAGDDTNPLKKGKSLIKALNDILSEGKPVWGMVSADIKSMLERFGMKSPPPVLLQTLMRFIPSGVLGGAKIGKIFPDGAVELEYSDVGKTTKYFTGNKEYYHKLAGMIDTNTRIPQMARTYLRKMIEQIARSSHFVKVSSQSINVYNYISVDEIL